MNSFVRIPTLIFMLSLLTSVACASSKGVSALKPKDLELRLQEGKKTLEKALEVRSKTPDSHIEIKADYFAWFEQCTELISKDAKSSLWSPCLGFAAQLLRAEVSGESAGPLIEPYQKQKKSWDETLETFSKDDRSFLSTEVKSTLDMQAEFEKDK